MSPLLFRRLSDETLGRRLAAGEAAAFDELYRRYAHRLSAYGAHLLGDGAAGDDVAQASLLKAYGALRDGRVPERMRPWLYRIAHNAAVDLVARRRELPSAELPELPGEDSADGGALVAALATLPDRQRRVYVLREIHGLRIDETAAELALTAQQVEQALFAARNRLAELLVFGERLSCVSVRRLVAGPLELSERRALKTHLRSCPACRSVVGRRALTLWPVPSLEWLRLLPGLGGVPVTAKVAAVATATVAAGASASFVVSDADHRPVSRPVTTPRPAAARAVRTLVVRRPAAIEVSETIVRPRAHVEAAPPPVSRTAPRPAPVRHVAAESHESRGSQDAVPEPVSAPRVDNSGPGSRHDGDGDRDGDDHQAAPAPASATTTATTTTTTTTTVVDNSGPGNAAEEPRDDGPPGESGGDGGSGSGSGSSGSGSDDPASGSSGSGSSGSGSSGSGSSGSGSSGSGSSGPGPSGSGSGSGDDSSGKGGSGGSGTDGSGDGHGGGGDDPDDD